MVGLGLDLNWQARVGFQQNSRGLNGHEKKWKVSQALGAFLQQYSRSFDYVFFSYQPLYSDSLFNDQGFEEQVQAYEGFVELLDKKLHSKLHLHQTQLNLATMDLGHPRELIAQRSNELSQRLGLRWINEDLGIWFLEGRALDYPLLPIFNKDSLKACIRNIVYYKAALEVPLVVEFPGFGEGKPLLVGEICPLEFFKECILRSDCDFALDTGHLLACFESLNMGLSEGVDKLLTLPWSRCREIHLAGAARIDGRIQDLHHGQFMQEQFELIDCLLEFAPATGLCLEDPAFKNNGELISQSEEALSCLKRKVSYHATKTTDAGLV